MKKFKKILALMIAMVMVFGMSTMAFAADEPETVTIEVAQDSTYAGTANEAGRTYSWYRVFTAAYTSDFTGTTGGGYDADGTPGTVTGDTDAVSYTASPAVAAKLGTIDATTKAWTTNSGNLWFDLKYVPGTGNYSVTWRSGVANDADTVQAAAVWLKANSVYDATGSLTWDSSVKKWTASGLEKGYYLIEGNSGANLVAATTNITINEKNSYPPVDKTQADEDNNVQTDQDKMVAVGDILTYEVKVTIPATAAVGETIKVYDMPSTGLQYNNDVTVKTNTGNATVAAVTGTDAVSGAVWTQLITVTAGSQGKDVVFTFTMTVTKDALTDPDKENDSGLVYNDYDSIPDKVYFKTYYTGIEKVDGKDNTKKLEGVEFTLKEGDTEFKVSKDATGGFYYYDANGSSTVVTDANGLIIIRGLDNDKTYTLTETKTQDGYNLLEGPVTLILVEDGYTTTAGEEGEEATVTPTYDPTTQFTKVENNEGTVLPSTGGMGTTILYIVGGVVVAAALVLLITKRRMRREDY